MFGTQTLGTVLFLNVRGRQFRHETFTELNELLRTNGAVVKHAFFEEGDDFHDNHGFFRVVMQRDPEEVLSLLARPGVEVETKHHVM